MLRASVDVVCIVRVFVLAHTAKDGTSAHVTACMQLKLKVTVLRRYIVINLDLSTVCKSMRKLAFDLFKSSFTSASKHFCELRTCVNTESRYVVFIRWKMFRHFCVAHRICIETVKIPPAALSRRVFIEPASKGHATCIAFVIFVPLRASYIFI